MSSAIGLRRLVSQCIAASARCEEPAEVVERLCALQAQDYRQSLWAIGARLRSGTVGDVERSIEQRSILRTWLVRGTIHFVRPGDVRWLLALSAPRLAAADARSAALHGLTAAQIDRCAELISDALSGDRRLARPEALRLLAAGGIDTTGQRGYHILVRLARRGLICLGPMQGKQPTIVLLDEWAPRAAARDLAPDEAMALLASRFAIGRGPVTEQDLARWAGVPVAAAARGLRAADGLARRRLDGVEYWLAADQAEAPPPAAGRGRTYLLAGFDEFFLGYKDRAAVVDGAHVGKIFPGANGVFRPLIVTAGRIVGTWSRSVRGDELVLSLQPFGAEASELARAVRPEADRYRDFLGLPSRAAPLLRTGP